MSRSSPTPRGLAGRRARVRTGLRHLLPGRRIEVYPEPEEREGFRLEADMLLFASPLGRPQKDETPREDPERLVRLVAGARYAPVCRLPVALELPVEGRVAV